MRQIELSKEPAPSVAWRRKNMTHMPGSRDNFFSLYIVSSGGPARRSRNVPRTGDVSRMMLSRSFSRSSGDSPRSKFIVALANHKLVLVASLIVLLMNPTSARAQAWSDIINPTRAANWQRANVGVPGGIPTTYTQCGSTVAAGASAAMINAALAACGQNQFVLLGPGTFNLSSSITIQGKSNLILRGSGSKSTFLVFSAAGTGGSFSGSIYISNNPQVGSDNFRVQPPCGGSGNINCGTWSSGFSQGTTSITLSKVGTTGILNGDMIVLDQQGDTSDTGGYVQCENTSPLTCMAQNAVEGRVMSGTYWVQEQFVRVVSGCSHACNGAGPYAVTVSPGLYANNWNQGNGAGKTGVWFVKPVSHVGVENLTVDDTSCPDDITCQSGITFFDVDGGWVRNIRVLNTRRNHVWLSNSSHMEIRDSYFYGTKNGESQSYGVESFPAFDSLIENNIFQQVASPIMFGGGAGNVIGYNFSIDNVYGPATFSQGSYFSHSGGNYMNLFEGNIFNSLMTDQLHGTNGLITGFRNWINGLDWNTCTYSGGGCTNTNNFANHPSIQTQAIFFSSYSRGLNLIGNVLGTPGYHTTYQLATPTASSSTSACNATVYMLGYSNGAPSCNIGGNGGVADDPMVTSTLMRWGNYDVATATVRFDGPESSPGAVSHISAQSALSSHTLPASFYLSSTPAFFTTPQGTRPFPLIGPDVVGGDGGFFSGGTFSGGICQVGKVSGGGTCASSVGGFANINPAMNCFFNVLNGAVDGSGAQLPFDATSCYSSSSALLPQPPTNLTVVVQ
jgi:hypothetical protein